MSILPYCPEKRWAVIASSYERWLDLHHDDDEDYPCARCREDSKWDAEVVRSERG